MLIHYLNFIKRILLLSGLKMFRLISFFSYRFNFVLRENITAGLFRR